MDFSALKRFQDYLTGWRIPGNDCMVTVDHEPVYRYYTGWADREAGRPMRGDELYYFWSASKVITTSLGMKLHEQGLFTMNDPVAEYMPEFRHMKVRVRVDGRDEIADAKRPILVRHLFNMTAGFDYNFGTPAVEEVRKGTGGRCPTREVARAIAESPLCFEPGERWQYSLCHDVLGAFIEVIAGKRLRDYAREVLFDPLGMDDTCYNLPDPAKMERMAVQYNWRDDMKFADTVANGGTSADGYRYLSPASVELWRRDTLTPSERESYNWSQLAGYGYGFGVRTMVNPAGGGSLGPVGEFGWGGAAGVWVILDPDNRVALVYTQHMLNNQEPFISPRLRNILYACL